MSRRWLLAAATATLALLVAVLLEVQVLMDWSYQRGRSDLYARVLDYRMAVDSALRACVIPKAAP